MATANKQILQHPSHPHPLELQHDSSKEGKRTCRLCHRKIWSTDYYTCREGCDDTDFYTYHRACAQAPPRIDPHPLHPKHPLILTHGIRHFTCDHCDWYFDEDHSSFRCDECDFDLDTGCALSALPDIGGSLSQGSEKITLPIHPHTLTSFSTRHDFVGGRNCYICRECVQGDGYTCLEGGFCEFVIHKSCVQDVYYADGTKAPTVYHGHQLEIHTSFKTCASCGSDKSGEFIGCSGCRVFYHRQCFQVPEIIIYPSHDPDHRLVLSLDVDTYRVCQSCSIPILNEISYRCAPCGLSVHIECALKIFAHKMELPWHKHPLFLCRGTESSWYVCNYCQYDSMGPMYMCKEWGCKFTLHKRCTEVESTITHPHHPDHPLSLCERNDGLSNDCQVCGEAVRGLKFSCKRCSVDLHVECAALFPTHKHCLHEHKLIRLERFPYAKCNRCRRSTDSPVLRCVPCNFNLHEDCMELPRVVKSKIHWHPVTLQSIFLEDDSGEYYCEECEQTRDPRLGVYVCGQCHISIPRIYHIHCVLPELTDVNVKGYRKESLFSAFAKVKEQIANKKGKLEETKRELEELEKESKRLQEEIEEITGTGTFETNPE